MRPLPHPGGGFSFRRRHRCRLTALKCKECGETYELDAQLRLRAVLRSARGQLRPLAARRPGRAAAARSRPGPPSIWRYSDFLPFERRPQTALDAGFTPLIRSERLAERLGVGEVYVKNDAANPTHSFKDRVVSVALAKAQRARLRGGRLRLDRQPRERRRGARRRRGPRVLRLRARPTSRSRRSSRPASTARTWSPSTATTTTSTGSAPSSPASIPGRS